MSLVARRLEQDGIPTVVIGSALDIVTTVGAPRLLFSDVPLGNPVGPPDDRVAQRATVTQALEFVIDSSGAETVGPTLVARSPLEWPTQTWRQQFMRVGDDNRAALARAGEERRQQQAVAREGRTS